MTLEELVEALATPRGQRRLITHLDVYVRAPVRVALRRWRGARIGVHGEDDLVSEIFSSLLQIDARDLRRFDPTYGKSLEQFVSLYARSRVLDAEKKELRRRSLFERRPPDPGRVDRPDELVIAVDESRRVRQCLEAKLATPSGREMLELLFVRGLSTEEAVELGHDRARVYRWRHTIQKLAAECWATLSREPVDGSRRRVG